MFTININEHIAVMMLKTQFPRLLGDVGNPQTYLGRVKYYVLNDARVSNVVSHDGVGDALKQQFIALAKQAEREGAALILTSCGFLVSIQSELSHAVSVPVISSSLTLLPMLEQYYDASEIAIVTADSSKLSKNHLVKVSQNHDKFTIIGMQTQSNFASIILADSHYGDERLMRDVLEKESIQVINASLNENKRIRVILLECTNLVPYANAIEKATQCPIFHLNTLIKMIECT